MELSAITGVNPSVLKRFSRFHGKVTRSDAVAVTDRLRSFLRSQDQATQPEPQERPRAAEKTKPLSFQGEQWAAVSATSEIKTKIQVVATMLDSILENVKHTNAPPEEHALTELERQQLIAILETTLAILKGPLVEKGLLKKARGALESGAAKAVEKGAQEGLGQMMNAAKGRLIELIATIFT
jgi:hypothetical protein